MFTWPLAENPYYHSHVRLESEGKSSGMFIIRWATRLVDTVNSWEEGIALSVMIVGGGCALILFIYVYSHLYHMLYPTGNHQRPVAPVQHAAAPPAPVRISYSHHFGRPRDLDSRGSEARAAGMAR